MTEVCYVREKIVIIHHIRCIYVFVCLLFVFIWFSRLTQRLRDYVLFFWKDS